ncbi:glycolate oxidase iron-sulfur subunit [Burkholderia stabilis]|nr:glycolate oxidase iron-sulfur subunit [Burkholderia stabilis]
MAPHRQRTLLDSHHRANDPAPAHAPPFEPQHRAHEPLDALDDATPRRVAVHCPCTLQHAQRPGGAVERILTRLGFDLTNVADGHLCCGSAGTYSLTQPELATTLRDNRLDALEAARPDLIVTAYVGCQTHLNGAGRTPVRHWIELVDNRLVN